MAKIKELQGLNMDGPHGNMVGVFWETDVGTADHARWHVWLEIDKAASAGGEVGLPVTPYTVREPHKGLRKNPPLTAPTRLAGRGKWLDATAKAHAPMVQLALAEAERRGLYQQALDKAADKEFAERDARLQEQSDTMLAAAQQLVTEGLPGAENFAAQVASLSRAQRARMLQIIQAAHHSRKGG
jgi:hypothetical protein